MDPEACWREIVTLLHQPFLSQEDRLCLCTHLENFTTWIRAGGFPVEPPESEVALVTNRLIKHPPYAMDPRCPGCGEADRVCGEFDVSGWPAVLQDVECLHCHATWRDVLQLDGYVSFARSEPSPDDRVSMLHEALRDLNATDLIIRKPELVAVLMPHFTQEIDDAWQSHLELAREAREDQQV